MAFRGSGSDQFTVNMRIYDLRRLMYVGCILLLAMYVGAVALLLGFRHDENLQAYEPLDNSSGVVPNYRAGPSGHNLKFGGGIDNGPSLQRSDPLLQTSDMSPKPPPPLP
jgi:hypothetical protein